MSRLRKFDWDEARRLRGQGMTLRAIAERFGVSEKAVYFATDDRARAAQAARNAEWQRGGTCADCGCQISRNYSRPITRCRACNALYRSTSVRGTTLRCVICRQWKPDNDFPHSRAAYSTHRGRHHQCRACSTESRRAYREKRKVPCANGCGRLVLAPNEQQASARSHGRHQATGMCLACANATRAARAQGVA